MIEYNSAKKPSKIVIPISGLEEILKYQHGILGLLDDIDLLTCGPTMRDHVRVAFELLNHMLCAESRQKLIETDEVKHFNEAFEKEISALKISLPPQQPTL